MLYQIIVAVGEGVMTGRAVGSDDVLFEIKSTLQPRLQFWFVSQAFLYCGGTLFVFFAWLSPSGFFLLRFYNIKRKKIYNNKKRKYTVWDVRLLQNTLVLSTTAATPWGLDHCTQPQHPHHGWAVRWAFLSAAGRPTLVISPCRHMSRNPVEQYRPRHPNLQNAWKFAKWPHWAVLPLTKNCPDQKFSSYSCSLWSSLFMTSSWEE